MTTGESADAGAPAPGAAADAAPATGGGGGPSLPGNPAACVVAAWMPYSRSGIQRGALGTVGEAFEVRVHWSSAPAETRGATSYCAAECGEYHQFVKGHIRYSTEPDGSNPQDAGGFVFGGLKLDENQFREDGQNRKPTARYGHRREKQTMDETFDPDRATGTSYIGRDFPNLSIGMFADLDLTFRGDLVDTCQNTVPTSETWRVQYRGMIRP